MPRDWHKANKIEAIKQNKKLSQYYETLLKYIFARYEFDQILAGPRGQNTMGTTILISTELFDQLYRAAALNGTFIKTLTDKALNLYASTTAEHHTTH